MFLPHSKRMHLSKDFLGKGQVVFSILPLMRVPDPEDEHCFGAEPKQKQLLGTRLEPRMEPTALKQKPRSQ